jgi:monooxygenase
VAPLPITLVPALVREGAHVVMLQRSPSYILSIPSRDPLAALLHRLPARIAYPIVRWKNVLLSSLIYQLSQRFPRFMKRLIRKGVAAQLPDGYPVDTDFAPSYGPWDQRLCLVPDGDLFAAIRSGDAEVVTDQVQGFTEHGLRVASGRELPADVVVTATGLNLLLLGGIDVIVDGVPVVFPDTVGYKGIMFSGVPNLAVTVGYTNASWTLKADLTADYVIRLLRYMREHQYRVCTPQRPATDEPTQPFINLESGYVTRSAHLLPRQGSRTPWRLHQNYIRDVALLRHGRIDDGALEFAVAGQSRSSVRR